MSTLTKNADLSGEYSATKFVEKNADPTAIKIPFLRKIGYGFGEAGSTLSWTLISSYLTVFYSDVVGLAPAIISIIMLIARIWQAICDPVFGVIAENTNTKIGRYRPYILFGAPILALFNCLTFLNMNLPSGAKAVFCAVTYMICCAAYSVANGAVACVINSMTSINAERVSANAVKGVVSSLAGMVVNAITMPLIMYFGNGDSASAHGFFMTALIFSVCSLPFFYICFKSSIEVIKGSKNSDNQKRENVLVNIAKSFAGAFKDWNVAWLMIAMLIYLTALFGRISIMAYYFIYVTGNAIGIAAFGTAMTAGMMFVNIYAPVLLNKIDKKYVAVIACICQAACCVAFYFMGEAKTANIIIAAIGFIYGATNMVSLVSVSLCGELIDDNWIRTGSRSDGVIVTAVSFSTKIANAIGSSVGIAALGFVGFAAGTEMSAKVISNVNGIINFMPAALFLLAIIPFMMIRMTNKKGKENENKIQEMMAQKN